MLIEASKPENERIVNFVKENYLYLDKVVDFDQKSATFLEKQEITLLDIYNFLESVRLKDDNFTFFIFDEYYDMMLEEDLNNKLEYKTLSDNIQYIKIDSFTIGIDEQFKSVLKKLPNPQEQTLVIDLRDNPGGLATTANRMLDFLLPECVISSMVDRTGEIFSYDSDKNLISFKHIYIFVNEESASSSELLTLALKTYLDNVTVIGRPTLGKGVSQKAFESKKNKYMIFLVDAYWNVNEISVSNQKIQPDIKIKGNELSHYTDAMEKHLLGK
jgi:C-terminal peptidase prc